MRRWGQIRSPGPPIKKALGYLGMYKCICAHNSLNTERDGRERGIIGIELLCSCTKCQIIFLWLSYYCCFGIRTNIYEFVITLWKQLPSLRCFFLLYIWCEICKHSANLWQSPQGHDGKESGKANFTWTPSTFLYSGRILPSFRVFPGS